MKSNQHSLYIGSGINKMDTVVFWDFDGTLVHSGPLWSSSVYKALKETDSNTQVLFEDVRKHMAYGFTWHTPDEDYRSLIGDKWWNFMNRHFYSTYIKLGVDDGTAQIAAGKVRNIIKKQENYTLYDDALGVLIQLKKSGVKNVLLSNNYPELEEVLGKLGLTEYLDGIIVSALEGYDKPRAELFEIAKDRFPAAKYFMIGDSVSADVIGGKNAGMTTVFVHGGWNENADYCCDDLRDIVDLITEGSL